MAVEPTNANFEDRSVLAEPEFTLACRNAGFGKCLLRKLREHLEHLPFTKWRDVRYYDVKIIEDFADLELKDPRRSDFHAVLRTTKKHILRQRCRQQKPSSPANVFYGAVVELDLEMVTYGPEFVHDMRGK